MTIQKHIENTLNYFISKFYLEKNDAQASIFEKILEKFNDVTASAKKGKLSPTKKHFSEVITLIKENIKGLKHFADRRLLRSLLALTFMVRRASNKEKNYLTVLNLDQFNSDSEFSKSRLINDRKSIKLSYPKK